MCGRLCYVRVLVRRRTQWPCRSLCTVLKDCGQYTRAACRFEPPISHPRKADRVRPAPPIRPSIRSARSALDFFLLIRAARRGWPPSPVVQESVKLFFERSARPPPAKTPRFATYARLVQPLLLKTPCFPTYAHSEQPFLLKRHASRTANAPNEATNGDTKQEDAERFA